MEFVDVYDEYVDIVYSYLRQRIKDRYLIEDIMQDTFLSIYNNLDRHNKSSSLKSWILTITHHRMVDRLRKNSAETLSIKDDDIKKLLTGNFPSNKIIVKEIFDKLEGKARTIIYGLYVLELSCKELSNILDIPVGTVKSKAYYSRQKLKKWLREGNND